jgi:hypothetical protein
MNKTLALCFVAITLFSCGVNKQAQQMKALEKCTYVIASANQITVAGTDIQKVINQGGQNLGSLSGLALGLFRKNVPLKANLNLEITNPTGNEAAINEFEYKILINREEVATGFVNQNISIAPGKTILVPVQVNANVYPLISNQKLMDEVTKFLQAGKGDPEQKGLVTLKIKPSFLVGKNLVKYPGFITIDKEISSKILL